MFHCEFDEYARLSQLFLQLFDGWNAGLERLVFLQRVEDCRLHAPQMIQRDGVEEIRSNDEVAENRVNRRRIDGEFKGKFWDLLQYKGNVFGGERGWKHGGQLDESVFVNEFGDRGL